MNSSVRKLKLVRNHLSKRPSPVTDAAQYFEFDSILTKEEVAERNRFREFLNKHVKKQMIDYVQNADTPIPLMKRILKEFPGLGFNDALTPTLQTALNIEMIKTDSSISVAFSVSLLAANTIFHLGSDEQKKKFIPGIISGELFGCFALIEPESGSDIAKKMSCAAKPVDGGYIINGTKTWVGNASFADVIILWARNTENKLVQGFIVEKGMKGLSTEVLTGKLSARGVLNAKIFLENVFIPEENKLPLAQDFTKGAAVLLVLSRLGVGVSSVASSMAAYELALDYSLKRKQFGKPIAGFQLIQEKLYRIMASTQAMLFMCIRLLELVREFKLSPGMASMAKAYCSKTARENLRLAREIMGGNGILMENHVMTMLLDVESQFTYEGAYDINNLILGNELTGINAIV